MVDIVQAGVDVGHLRLYLEAVSLAYGRHEMLRCSKSGGESSDDCAFGLEYGS